MSEPNLRNVIGVRGAPYDDYVKTRIVFDGCTQITAYSVTVNATNTLYTVTSEKTLYLTSMIISYWARAAGTQTVYIDDTVPATWQILWTKAMIDGDIGDVPMSFNPPLEIPAGYAVKSYSGAASVSHNVFIHGWEK